MSKTLTVSLQNLNSLYFKYLNQFVLQYLPKPHQNQLLTLLSLKSPLDVYRYLDNLINTNSIINSQKKQSVKQFSNNSNLQEKSNVSYQGSTSYLSKDDMKFNFDQQFNNTNDMPKHNNINTTLKRTQTYKITQQETTNQKFLQDLKSFNFNLTHKDSTGKQKQKSKQQEDLILKQVSQHTNIVKHDFDTFSEKHPTHSHHSSNHPILVKKQSKQHQNNQSNQSNQGSSHQASSGNMYQYKVKYQQQQGNSVNHHNETLQANNNNKYNFLSKQKNEQGNSTTGYKKIQFGKTYSIKQVQKTQKGQKPSGQSSNLITVNHVQNSNNPYGSLNNLNMVSNQPTLNRSKLQSIIKQTKQIFKENQKKIERYQKISGPSANNSNFNMANTNQYSNNLNIMNKTYKKS